MSDVYCQVCMVVVSPEGVCPKCGRDRSVSSLRAVCTFHRRHRYAADPATSILLRQRLCGEPSGRGSGGVERTCRRVASWYVTLPDPTTRW